MKKALRDLFQISSGPRLSIPTQIPSGKRGLRQWHSRKYLLRGEKVLAAGRQEGSAVWRSIQSTPGCFPLQPGGRGYLLLRALKILTDVPVIVDAKPCCPSCISTIRHGEQKHSASRAVSASRRGAKRGFLGLWPILPGSRSFSEVHGRVSEGHRGKPEWWRANQATVQGREGEGCFQAEKTVEQAARFSGSSCFASFPCPGCNKLTPGPIPSTLKALDAPIPCLSHPISSAEPRRHPKSEAGYTQLSFIFSF